MSGAIRALYDISILGHGHYLDRARAGIFRTVERVALGLAERPEVTLSLCASRHRALAWGYLRDSGPFAGRRLATSPLATHASDRFYALSEEIKRPEQGAKVWQKARRKGWWAFLRAGELAGGAVPSDALEGADLYHSPFFPFPPEGRSARRLPRVLTVYDLIPVKFPHFFGARERADLTWAIRQLRPADWALCISEATREDLLEFRPDLDPRRVVVTPLAAADHFRPCEDLAERSRVREKYRLPEAPYLLSLSTLEPRKNIEAVVIAFGRLVERGLLGNTRLVLVGAMGWKYGAVVESLERLGALRERVTVTGFAADEDLSALYSGALMFVYPSQYEGFGLPVLEAMQCGVPVVTSDNSSLPEVVGDAGLMIPAEDGEALEAALLRLYEDEGLRRQLAAQGLARAATFSWQRTVDQTVAVYRRAVG